MINELENIVNHELDVALLHFRLPELNQLLHSILPKGAANFIACVIVQRRNENENKKRGEAPRAKKNEPTR